MERPRGVPCGALCRMVKKLDRIEVSHLTARGCETGFDEAKGLQGAGSRLAETSVGAIQPRDPRLGCNQECAYNLRGGFSP